MVMTDETSAPANAGIEQRTGYCVGFGVLGVVTLAAILVVGDQPLEDLVFCLLFTPVFGVLMWLLSRRKSERLGPATARTGGAEGRRAFLGGLAQAALVAAGIGVFVVLFVWAFGSDQGWAVLPGVMLGSALWVALEVRDRRRGRVEAEPGEA